MDTSDSGIGYDSEARDLYFHLIDKIRALIGEHPLDVATIRNLIASARTAAVQAHADALAAMQSGIRIFIGSRRTGEIIVPDASEQDIDDLYSQWSQLLSGYERVTNVSMWPIPAVDLRKHESELAGASKSRGLEYFVSHRSPMAHVGLLDHQLHQLLKNDPHRKEASMVFKETANVFVAKALAFYEPEITQWINSHKSVKFEVPPQNSGLQGFDIGRPVGRILIRGDNEPRTATKIKLTLIRDAENHGKYWIKKVLAKN